ncbi:MAG: hypothetical protein JSW56_11365 [Deltaproteobacteria bacterium]|nr:MAG: hypothetical protein JSW56_11365 [Deltaproteobacteria bacterium]
MANLKPRREVGTMPKQIILYNLREDVKEEDYIKWCNSFKGPLLLGLNSTKSFTLLRMLGGRKGNGQQGISPEKTKPPFRFVGILDISSPEEWMKDMASDTYQKDFFPKFFSEWAGEFYAIIGEEVYHGESD